MKTLVSAVAAIALGAAILTTPTTAGAECACANFTDTKGTATTDDDVCEDYCCDSRLPEPLDPPSPPSGPPPACGEICLLDGLTGSLTNVVREVDELILVAGAESSGGDVPVAGCVALLGGAVHSGQAGNPPDPTATYTQCKAEAVAACRAAGCAHRVAIFGGPCP